MTVLVLTKYIHFISIFVIISALIAKQVLISKSVRESDLKRVLQINRVYWFGIILSIIAGLILWFWVGKPAEFYTKNWIFHTKLTLYVAAIAVSLDTTIRLNKLKSDDSSESIKVPALIGLGHWLTLILFLLIPLLASFVALGVGAF